MVLEIRNARENTALFENVQCIARLKPFSSEELASKLDFAAWIDEFFPGLGTMWECYPCELVGFFGFSLLRGMDNREKDELNIFADRVDRLSLILFALRIEPVRVTWRIDREPGLSGDWETVRQDDNGNQFVLDSFVDYETADACAGWWNRLFGDHKQSALVRKWSDRQPS